MVAGERLGEITVCNDVLAELAGFAALECYGVVGMANPTLKAGVAQLLSRDRLTKGIKITQSADGYSVDLYVIIEYGTNLAEVSKNLSTAVRYKLEKHAEIRVEDVFVHVQSINVRDGG